MRDFLTLARDRYSCRQMSDRPVEKEKINAVIEAGLAAPTAHNNQPFRIWVIESPENLAKIRSTSKQAFVNNCSVIFVVGADPKTAWVREYDGKNFAEVDASIAATQMMLEVEDLGLATTWIGHFDVNLASELFPEMKAYELVAMFAVGYAAEDAKPSGGHFMSKPEEELVIRI